MAKPKNVLPRQRHMSSERRATLTSPEPLLHLGAPKSVGLNGHIAAIYRAAAATEISDAYAKRIATGSLSRDRRLALLRAALVLAFNNASVRTVWEAVEEILAPALAGLCEGRYENGGVRGTGMCGSDGRDHLRDLERDEGEPLTRIAEAVERYRPIEVGPS